jgi:hypothetical protein
MRLRSFLAGDRRLLLLVLSAMLSVVLGFFALTPDQSLRAVIKGGYWAMLVISTLFAWSLWKLLRSEHPLWERLRTARRWPASLIAVCGTILLVHESYGFKILMDEAMLLGTSMSMHFEKVALVPMRGNDIQGAFQVLNGQLDKRPLFHPFLTSIVHDVSGYRPENVFVLNTLLTFVLLALAYRAGRRLAGPPGGALAVVLLTSLPLLAQNATGGGFEVLNLVMILSTLLLGMRFAEKRDPDSQEAFVLSGILLAQTRYESVLFILPVALLIFWVWWREQRPVLSTVLCFAPLLLLPYALHNKVFSARESSWELASQPGYEKVFSVDYLPANLSHALNFFFNPNGEQSNSLVISILGFLALPFFVLWAVKILRSARERPPAFVAMAVFALGFAAHTALLLCYFWGKFDDPVIRRLSLPLNLALVLGVIVVATEFGRGLVFRVLIGLAVVGMFAHSLPAMARHDFTLDYYIGREAEWRREFIKAHPERDYLVVDNSSIFWITHLVSATPMMQIALHKENLLFHYRNHTFTSIYVFQSFDVDADTGALTVRKDDDLGPDYELQPVWERRFTPLRVSRISRVLAIKEGPATPPRPAPPPIEKLSREEQERIRQEYFQKFIQKLP